MENVSLEDLERKVKESLELEQITDVEETKINSEPVVIEQITMTEVMQETPEIIKLVEPSKFIMDDFNETYKVDIDKDKILNYFNITNEDAQLTLNSQFASAKELNCFKK